MAQLVVAAAGAAIGYATFGVGTVMMGMSGAQLGWMAGSMVGSMFAPTQKSQGPKLGDLSVSGSAYGTPIPWIAGHPRLAGQVVWASAKREIATTQSSGGKGGGGSEYTTYTYEVDLLILLTDNEIGGVTRIWSNGELIYNGLVKDGLWSRMTVYSGGFAQLPDPTYEAAVGAASASAYRGRGTVFIQSLQLGGGGSIPNLTFEACRAMSPNVLWTTRTIPAGNWQSIAWNGSVFCAVGYTSVAATSPDGNTWTARTIPAGVWTSVVWNGTVFCAVGNTGICATSLDGVTWTGQTIPAGNRSAVGWNGSVLCAVGNSVCTVSSNGSFWESKTIPAGNWQDIAWNGSLFCAVEYYGACATSPDGITWTTRTIPAGNWYAIGWNGDVFCAVGASACATSPDGITWTARTIPTGFWESISWNGSAFCAVGYPNAAATSPDGITWSSWAIPAGNWYGVAWNGDVFCAVGDSSKCATSPFGAIPLDDTVSNVVSDVCLRSGLGAGQFDASALTGTPRPVRALANGSVSTARTLLEMLANTYQFDAVLSDKIYFKPRGSAPVATITFDELGVMQDSATPGDPLPLTQANELEIPAQLALTYSNVDGDYQTDTQYSDRLLTGMESTSAVQVPLGFTASEAKQIADTLLLDKAVSALSTSITLDTSRANLQPLDVVMLTGEDSSSYRMRIIKRTDAGGVTTLACVADDASILTQGGATSGGTASQTVVLQPATTSLVLLDIPLLRDADNLPGFYVAVMGSATNWANCAVYDSLDDLTYSMVTTMADQTAIGTCSTTLDTWAGGNVFDETNTVTVNVGAIQQLVSVTRDNILADQSINAALIGSELVQYRTAALVGTGVYTLSGLLRGRRGTEWATTHAGGETFVGLGTSGLRFVALQSGDLGRLRYYKAASAGQKLSALTAQSITPVGVALECFSPVNARANRDAADTVITWTRRTRLSTRLVGTLGINAPLGETTEAYEVEVWDSTYATLKRTLTASTPTATYTSADQVADFGGNQATLYLKIYQLSATVARGFPLTVSI